MSNKNIKVRKGVARAFYLLPIALAFGACSDWDDHYDAGASVSGTSNKTLWETISQNDELTDFASVLKAHGYDSLLDGEEKYTVWAPVNGTFSLNSLNNVSSSRAVTQFLQNHIAHNAYVASGEIDERIYTLNTKAHTFTGSPSSYVISDVSVKDANCPVSNGVLHTLNGFLTFRQNIYESLNTDDYAIDSIVNYIHSYDQTVLDEEKSTVGPVLNGEQTYLDSVVVESNGLFPDASNTYTGEGFYAYISTEDSSYTMIVPTNKAWTATKKSMEPCFNYIPLYKYRNEVLEAPASGTAKKADLAVDNEELTIGSGSSADVKVWRDSIVNRYLIRSLLFNDNYEENRKLKTLATGQRLVADSLVITEGDVIYNDDCGDLFEGATRVDKSNGAVWITDSIRYRPWMYYNNKIDLEAEMYSSASFNSSTSRESVTSSNRNPAVSGEVSNNAYCLVTPASSVANPQVVFNLYENVRSTSYNVYVVIVPGNITNANTTPLPNNFRASVGYHEADGTLNEKAFSGTFTSNPEKVDTISLGTFTFPAAYYGLGESSAYPYLRLTSRVSTSTASKYDRTLRVDKVMLIPTEMDEYIKEHPEYKYEQR